ncbi:MAG: CPBP family intramembrane metalloprotease [Elusimicrobia bacterium]|nr:CPBP family intramembrane metalloprotease [Elusimicrobiota bacterium]
MSYSEIGIKLPQKTDLKKNVLLLFSGTLACLLWLRLYAAAFKMLLPAEYDRVASWKNTSYVQFLSEWGKTGEFSGIMALWGGILLLVIIEELAFRGLIFNYLRREYSFKKALIWNSALFALPHLHPYIVPIPFALGLIFTMLYVKSKGLMVPVLTHFAYNLSLSYFGEFIS